MGKLFDRLKQHRQTIRWIGLVIGLIIFGFQVFVSIRAILGTNWTTSWKWVGASIIFCVLSQGLQLLAWLILMRGFGANLTMLQTIKGYIPSFIPRYIPGTVWGYLSRSEWLINQHGISFKISTIGSVLELAFSITANIVIILSSFLIANVTQKFIWWPTLVVGLILVFFVVATAFQIIIKLIKQNIHSTFPNIRFSTVYTCLLLFAATWALYGIGLRYLFLGFLANPLTFNPIEILYFARIYGLSWLIGLIVFIAPSGLGFREITLSYLLQHSMRVAISQSISIGVFMRFVVLISEMLWLLLAFVLKLIRPSVNQA